MELFIFKIICIVLIARATHANVESYIVFHFIRRKDKKKLQLITPVGH